MKAFLKNSHLFGSNSSFIEGMYEDYLLDPESVSDEWRSYFNELQLANDKEKDVIHSNVIRYFEKLKTLPNEKKSLSKSVSSDIEKKQVSVLQIINAHRFLGIRNSNIDPLSLSNKQNVPELGIDFYGLNENDLDTKFNTGSFVGPEQMTLRELLVSLKSTYCNTIGLEYMYISDVPQKRWIQDQFEKINSIPNYPIDLKKHFLERLTASETLEKYLSNKYVGQKRFSLEGGDTLIVCLDHMLQRCGSHGVNEVVIGMAHRGRLNVLVNTMGKMPGILFSEFEGKNHDEILFQEGDVKYHQGFSSDVMTSGGPMHVSLAFNPSHLEIVNPVVEGSVKARQHRRSDTLGKEVVPVLLHGDASFSGQGVVMETLNLHQTRGYGTGGTIHIVVNNQIGFTTSDIRDTRSTPYCTDIAKMIEAPVFHVNSDDPEAVALVTEKAVEYRMKFGKDVVIDLICFRKLGHNEQDEPMVTQPLMYSHIKKHPGSRSIYANKLVSQKIITSTEAEDMINIYRDALDKGHHTNMSIINNHKTQYTANWEIFKNIPWDYKVKTGLKLQKIKTLSKKLTTMPDNFKLHSRVAKILSDRVLMSQGKLSIDWGMAENLAYASLVDDGFGVRISGQDSGRGTFFHRHAVMHDQNRDSRQNGVYIPLQNISKNQQDFTVIDSLLSEEAVLGYEYGYTTADPNKLVVWEAQFGDFANGAQVVIDQFIAPGEVKWGRICSLVMMLPHGYEGQGPEHSSARIERYLQLCADYNMQVCIPSTPSQMFHLLRRQMLRPYRKPLIIFSPKSLLRHKQSVSTLHDISNGEFKVIIDDEKIKNKQNVHRVVFCSGKIYYELLNERAKRKIDNIALIRIEQLYPFPHDAYIKIIEKYNKAKQIVWCQEEPGNQGAWHRIQHYLVRHLQKSQKLLSAMRASSASTAGGYMALHNKRQKELINEALTT